MKTDFCKNCQDGMHFSNREIVAKWERGERFRFVTSHGDRCHNHCEKYNEMKKENQRVKLNKSKQNDLGAYRRSARDRISKAKHNGIYHRCNSAARDTLYL